MARLGRRIIRNFWLTKPAYDAGGAAPTNTVAPVVSGTIAVGATLSTTNGTWTGAPAFTYQWQRDNSGGGVFSNIGGATISTYLLTTSEVGCNIRCLVTGTNGAGAATATSNVVGPVSAVANFPTVGVEVAFASSPYAASPVYTDISTYALGGNTNRGRANNLTRIEAGSCNLDLDNADLRFDPKNTGGPYYPNVLPAKKLRISAIYNGITYYLYTGHVDRWPQSWQKPGYTISPVISRDAFSLMALNGIGDGSAWPAETGGARIGRVLDFIAWPASARVLETGVSTMVPATILAADNAVALQHIQDIADSDLGILFVDGQGRVVFQDRHHRLTPASIYTALATFGDGGGAELDWDQIEPDYDVDRVVNDWRITPSGSTVVQKTDATSISGYGQRTQQRTPLVSDQNDCTTQAEYLLAFTKDPQMRFDALVLNPSALQPGALQDSIYAQALGREIGDRITVKARPPGGAYTITQDCYIEGISHAFSATQWSTKFLLSPADPLTYWILGDAVYSLLGQTTVLAP